MKKSFLGSGIVVSAFALALSLGILFVLATPQSAVAQTGWSMQIDIPETNVLILANYMGIDRKLKPVPGQNVRITPPPGTTGNTIVTLTAVVRGEGLVGLSSCNGVISTATTVKFTIPPTGRTLTASDFTSSGGIGIQTSTDTKKCIDDLSDLVSKGVGSAPPGQYILDLTANNAATGAQLASKSRTITIIAASAAEVNLNLISPLNGESISQISPTFQFDAQKAGKLFVFEHNTLSQSSEDAIRDLNSPLKALDASFSQTGQNQITYSYPGNARRLLQVGKKYTWFIRAEVLTGGGRSETKRSPLYTFTFTSSDPNFITLQNALSNAAPDISNSYTNAASSGYRLNYSGSNQAQLQEGNNPPRTIDINQALSILNRLSAGGVKIISTSITD